MTLHWSDQVIIVVYLLAMAGIGVYFARRNKSTEEYFAGGRSHGGFLLGLSMVGSVISSITFIALPADSYKTAWFRYANTFAIPIGILLTGYFFVPLYRRTRVTSAYEYLEARFNSGVRLYAAIMFAIIMLLRLSAVLYLLSVVIKTITGLDPNLCIVLAGIITALYTVFGGLNAVIWTDAIQTVVLVGGSLIILAILIGTIDGGLLEVFRTAWIDHKLSFYDLNTATGQLEPSRWGLSLTHKSVSMMMIVGLTGALGDFATNQVNVQRYIAAGSARDARRTIWVCAGMSIPIWTIFLFIGTCLYVFYKQFPDATAQQILTGADNAKAEDILPHFLTTQVPVGIVGIIVAGIAAAAMSTLSACLNSFSSSVTMDIYRRQIMPNRSDRHYLVAGWLFTMLAAVVMVGGAWALLNSQTKTLNDFLVIVNGITHAGMLAVFLLGFFTKRTGTLAVSIGIGLTVIFALWCTISNKLPATFQVPFDLYYTVLLGNLLLYGVGYLIALMIPNKRPVPDELTYWGQGRAADTP